MAFSYTTFASTPATLTADLKTNILLCSDWANITGDIVKSTTTRGAQLVLNLAKVAANAQRLGLSAWRTHDGTTGVDESTTRYLNYHASGGATSDVLHCAVSVSKEHVYIWVDGPAAGEVNPSNAVGQSLYLGDIIPYHASDATPAAALVACDLAQASSNSPYIAISRNQADTASWVSGVLASLSVPSVTSGPAPLGLTAVASGDGKTYLWPYVVVEAADGLRGRLADVFFVGWNNGAGLTDPQGQLGFGATVSYDGKTYQVQKAWRRFNYDYAIFTLPWAAAPNTNSAGQWIYSPLIAVRTA